VSDVTKILENIRQGDKGAEEELLLVVYDELRRLAAIKMAHELPGHTLQPTALVHEAWLRLTGSQPPHWENRAHFFGAAAEAMRRILIDSARRKQARRHGGGQQRVSLDDLELAGAADDTQLLSVHEALDQFAAQDPVKAELVKLRYFVGLTIEETADVLNISEPTAKRYWSYARAWLYRAITEAEGPFS
jgi:RNA polymerase sigma factor (TIGR02999 family)